MIDEPQNRLAKHVLALMKEDRKRARKGLWWFYLLMIVAAVGLGVFAVAMLSFAAKALDNNWWPDDAGAYSAAWLRTRDIAPGDDVAISVAARNGAEAITRIRARLGDRELQLRRAPSEASVDEFTFVFAIPEDAPLGAATLAVDLSLFMVIQGRDHEIRETERSDQLRLPFEVRSRRARTIRVVIDGALALGALLGAFAIAYSATRFRRKSRATKWETIGEQPATPHDEEGLDFFIFLGVLVVIALAMVGHLVFVRTLWRMTSIGSPVFKIGLLAIWLAAIVTGTYYGYRARKRASNRKLETPGVGASNRAGDQH